MLQDWNNFYATSDKAIEKFPDDGTILTLVGWVIPHQVSSSDPDAKQKLEKAEAYETHALELITNMPQPAKLSPKEFAAAKEQMLSQAHSGLGLVYFHNGAYDASAKELQQATQMGGSADPTDLYALGISLEGLNRYGEAADAYQKCGAISGDLQDRCKQSASQDKTPRRGPAEVTRAANRRCYLSASSGRTLSSSQS